MKISVAIEMILIISGACFLGIIACIIVEEVRNRFERKKKAGEQNDRTESNRNS